MKQIAIDIVLLPSNDMINKAIDLNKKNSIPNKPSFQLNKKKLYSSYYFINELYK